MVRFLLEAGADQEHKTDEMHTALMEACMVSIWPKQFNHNDIFQLTLNLSEAYFVSKVLYLEFIESLTFFFWKHWLLTEFSVDSCLLIWQIFTNN